MAFIGSPRYGVIPATATTVTSPERKRDFPYLELIKSDIVVILWVLASLITFVRTRLFHFLILKYHR